jgi:hypothetical protein
MDEGGRGRGEIVLLEEVEAKQNDKTDVADLAGSVRSMKLDVDDDRIAKALDALALERGETANAGRASGFGEVAVHEHLNANTDKPAPPSLNVGLSCSSKLLKVTSRRLLTGTLNDASDSRRARERCMTALITD